VLRMWPLRASQPLVLWPAECPLCSGLCVLVHRWPGPLGRDRVVTTWPFLPRRGCCTVRGSRYCHLYRYTICCACRSAACFFACSSAASCLDFSRSEQSGAAQQQARPEQKYGTSDVGEVHGSSSFSYLGFYLFLLEDCEPDRVISLRQFSLPNSSLGS